MLFLPACLLILPKHQPFDGTCFSPPKRAYGKIDDDKMRAGVSHIDKLGF
jgi:hypothetical protein